MSSGEEILGYLISQIFLNFKNKRTSNVWFHAQHVLSEGAVINEGNSNNLWLHGSIYGIYILARHLSTNMPQNLHLIPLGTLKI